MATARLRYHTDEFHAECKARVPRTDDRMSKEERYAKLEHSYAQSLAAAGHSYEEVFDEISEHHLRQTRSDAYACTDKNRCMIRKCPLR